MASSTRPVVVITGVSGGIGRATAKEFAAHGWIVVGTVRGRRDTESLKSLQYDLQSADMTDPEDLKRVISGTWMTYGRLDALICNAGYGLIGPIDSLDYAQMSEQMTVNVLAPAQLVRLAVPHMREQGSGVIIGISSIFGRLGLPGYSLYAASKFGLEGLFESLSYELGPAGVRVKLVEPSGVNTGFWAGLKRGGERQWQDRELGPRTGNLAGKVHHGLSPERVAAAVYDAAKDMSGRLRYPVGAAQYMMWAQRLLPERLYRALVKRAII